MHHPGEKPYISRLAESCVQEGVSYLYLMPGRLPVARTGLDEPVPRGSVPIKTAHIEEFLGSRLSPFHRQIFDSKGLVRFAFGLCPDARCRVDLIATAVGPAMIMHFLPQPLPTPDELHIPRHALDLAADSAGVFLICGKPRAGKTTTLASVLQHLGGTRFAHVAWICSAAEYVIDPPGAFVNLVEPRQSMGAPEMVQAAAWLGTDVVALDLDVDEVLAWQTVSAAEKGAKVLVVVCAGDTAGGLETLSNAVSPDRRSEFTRRLSQVFGGAVYQELIRGTEAPVPAMEILVGTEPVRNLLQEGRFRQIPDLIAAGGKYGMQTLEMARKRLSDEGLI